MPGFFLSAARFVGKGLGLYDPKLSAPAQAMPSEDFPKKQSYCCFSPGSNVFSRPDFSRNSPADKENSHSPRGKTADKVDLNRSIFHRYMKAINAPAYMKKDCDTSVYSQSLQPPRRDTIFTCRPKATTDNYLNRSLFYHCMTTLNRPAYMKKDYKTSMYSHSLQPPGRDSIFACQPKMTAYNDLNRSLFYRCMTTLSRPAYVKKTEEYNMSMYSHRVQSLIKDSIFANQPKIKVDNYVNRGVLYRCMTSFDRPAYTRKAKDSAMYPHRPEGGVKYALQTKVPLTSGWKFPTAQPAWMYSTLCTIGVTLCRIAHIRRPAGALRQTLNQVNASRQRYLLPDLSYDYGALEPHISAQIMQLHHIKHHAAYVENLSTVEEKYLEALAKGDMTTQVALQPALKYNWGGHVNHTIFWTNLAPCGGGEPRGKLMEAIKRDFGSFQNMKERMSAASVAVQGSGWVWLGYDKVTARLRLAACANQDPLEETTGLIPLLGIDVWEHAYYLQYKNVQPDYVNAIWNVINWQNVGDRLRFARK